jgi:cell division septation protein DedD
MEEQTSWKGHAFTLLVFAGIVVLCSIFFILGMLVGRTQGQKTASTVAQPTQPDAKPTTADSRPDVTLDDTFRRSGPSSVLPAPGKPDPVPEPEPSPKSHSAADAPAVASPKAANAVNYQVGAVRKAEDAEKLLDEVKKKGFRAFILAPAADDPNPFFRVQVGPITDSVESQRIKKKLENAGYQPILKR